VQTTGSLPEQLPAWQVSVWVQPSPSSQAEPSGFCGFEQFPVAGLQVPASWQESWGVHTTGFSPAQIPIWQVSVWVHKLPSLQDVPSGNSGSEQIPVAGLQVPTS
jgi:hypothetical protein